MHSTRHFLKKKSFLNATKLSSIEGLNGSKVFSIRFYTSPPEQRNPTQMLLDILATADLNIADKKKPIQPTVSEKQNQADFFGLVLSEKSRETVAAGDEDLRDFDVAGEGMNNTNIDEDDYDEEDFDLSDLEDSLAAPPKKPSVQLAPEADVNSIVAVMQETLDENEERDLAQLVGSVDFKTYDEDQKPMKSIDEVFKMLFKSIESNTKEDTCLSGFLPSQEFYLKDLDYGSVVDTDGTQVFCLGLQVSHTYLHKLTTAEFEEYVFYLNRYFQQKFNLKAGNLRVKIMSRLGELQKASPFEYFGGGKVPAGDLKPGFEQKLDMSSLHYSDKLKAEQWFNLERYKFEANVHLTDHFFGEGENQANEANRRPGDAGGIDQFVEVKDIDQASVKAREEKFNSVVAKIKAGEKPTQEESELLKNTYENRKVSLRDSIDEPSWLRDNEDDFDLNESAPVEGKEADESEQQQQEQEQQQQQHQEEDVSQIFEDSDLVEVPIVKEEQENDDAHEEGSVTKAATATFQEDGWIDEKRDPKPPKGSIVVARGQHQFFCKEDFILRFDIYQPTSEYDDQSFLDVRGKNEEEEIDFFVKRDRYSVAETRY